MDLVQLIPVALNVLLGGGLLKVWLDGRATQKTATAAASKTDMERACELIEALQADNARLRLALSQQDKAISELRAENERQAHDYETKIDDLQCQLELLKKDNLRLQDSLAAYQSAAAGKQGRGR